MKVAITIYPDPGSEGALGRCFTAMANAHEFQQKGDEVIVIFGGTGVRWPAVLSSSEHPAHDLYTAIKPIVKGACSSCSVVFGAEKSVQDAGIDLIGGISVPNGAGSGLPSMRKLISEGYTILNY
ncbi:MAG TPA: hypothetical protein ENI73_01540 [Spirochaetes bacterium]|nr:hypothetical protein [Spirochaetota bacterium]